MARQLRVTWVTDDPERFVVQHLPSWSRSKARAAMQLIFFLDDVAETDLIQPEDSYAVVITMREVCFTSQARIGALLDLVAQTVGMNPRDLVYAFSMGQGEFVTVTRQEWLRRP